MVSQPEHTPSVVSRSSRQYHKHRSRHNSIAFVPQDEFPIFNDTGDVEILVGTHGQMNRYLLHRIILAQSSKFFEESTRLDFQKEPGETAKAQESTDNCYREMKRRWKYELDFGKGPHDIPVLVQRNINMLPCPSPSENCPPPVRNKPGHKPHQSMSKSESVVSHQSLSSPSHLCKDTDGLRQAYHNLFLIFYNYPPALDPTCISRTYNESKALLSLADLYDALPVVGPRIEHHLLRYQSDLWKHIAKYPPSYLHLGYFTKSQSIFQEAFVHVLGRWLTLENYIRERLPLCVTNLLEEKYRDLSELVRKLEIELWSLTLHTMNGKRVTPQTSYLDWLVVSLFREWLAECSTTSPSLSTIQSSQVIQSSKESKTMMHSEFSNNPQPQHNVLCEKDESIALTQNSYENDSLKPTHVLRSTARSTLSIHTIRPSALLTIGRSTPSAPTYLGHEQCRRFLKLNETLYTRENIKHFERRLEELRALAREVVKPVMASKLNNAAEPEEYLVCIGVEEGEWPWEDEKMVHWTAENI
ncbi:hypothetical protein GcM3_224004 [Golovinomyces cichoracearum]|uniref:BTB domain-containing protein n=1 Tax=Golovinomyces cichoracearum TaxID=62708 RepID=A0A420GUV6_9PEZI|nr:hypothetical protein GcM3_224004 [Golovinomyces cichoracearum]